MKKNSLMTNTILLYFRQIVILLTSLYTVRVVLDVLGETDYGIYNLIAGITTLFTFINSAMTSSTQRFLNFYMGENETNKVRSVFASSFYIHLSIAVIFIVVCETVGLVFVNYCLNIPAARMRAAVWVYHIVVITTAMSIIRVPYLATIISTEMMAFFAQVSIVEAFFKLIVSYAIRYSITDKLILYAVLSMIVNASITYAYIRYCKKFTSIVNYNKSIDTELFKELVGFSGWSVLGAFANVCNSQGTNVAINIFTNVIVNAAMGIANQVNSAVYSFISNFQTAFNPRLMKEYVKRDKEKYEELLITISKVSFGLAYLMILPLFYNCDFVLHIWLKEVPVYSCEFVKLILIWSLIDSLNGPLWVTAQVHGNIKIYQIVTSVLIFMNLPFSIMALRVGGEPYVVLIIRVLSNVVLTIWRLGYLNHVINLNLKRYIGSVLVRCFGVMIGSYVMISFVSYENKWMEFIVSTVVGLIAIVFWGWVLGIDSKERKILKAYIKKIRSKDKK